MNERMTVGSLYPNSIHPSGIPLQPKSKTVDAKNSFKNILDEKMLQFSQHAQQRLEQRGISLNSVELGKIETAVDKAEAKGAKESLIMYQDVALIVSIQNKTIITALDKEAMQDHVFTKIDSAVIVK